ncbi:hypothetical protein QBC36DRAFT_313658 [Triangularia setosa]|uniref:Uncharacterized protein n=1 Tax=Triangularia setosa TaxID=2587417 RepID=A0AAN6W3N6_9PEZI|nr:hypothetical protein QBC36DRAFT_313658 [Podospora setosa]
MDATRVEAITQLLIALAALSPFLIGRLRRNRAKKLAAHGPLAANHGTVKVDLSNLAPRTNLGFSRRPDSYHSLSLALVLKILPLIKRHCIGNIILFCLSPSVFHYSIQSEAGHNGERRWPAPPGRAHLAAVTSSRRPFPISHSSDAVHDLPQQTLGAGVPLPASAEADLHSVMKQALHILVSFQLRRILLGPPLLAHTLPRAAHLRDHIHTPPSCTRGFHVRMLLSMYQSKAVVTATGVLAGSMDLSLPLAHSRTPGSIPSISTPDAARAQNQGPLLPGNEDGIGIGRALKQHVQVSNDQSCPCVASTETDFRSKSTKGSPRALRDASFQGFSIEFAHD